jgi:hypothetical protein
VHGKPGTYNHYGCRCSDCWGAWRAYLGELRQRKAQALVDAVARAEAAEAALKAFGGELG